MAGVITGLLLATPFYWQSSNSHGSGTSPAQPEAVALPVAKSESRQALLQTLPALCENRKAAQGVGFRESEARGVIVGEQVRAGIDNARRLLPLARRLTLEALRETGAVYRGGRLGAELAKRRINAVRRVMLDSQLGDSAGVNDERPWEIRIGPFYAMRLSSDDETLFLLAHELTHVASWSGKLDGFIERLARQAKFAADVELTRRQKEDLACEFIAVKVFERFVGLKATEEAKAERLSRLLGYESPAERLGFAWDDFCFSYYAEQGYGADEEHLSNGEIRRALRELDPALGTLIPPDPSPPSP